MTYQYTNDGLRLFPNITYAKQPRLVNNLPYGKIKIVSDTDRKAVEFHCKLFVGEIFRFPQTYSTDFTDAEILADQDLETWLIDSFGFKLKQSWGL